MSEVKLVASRFLLPLEFYIGAVSVAWGLSGGLGKGLLHDILKEDGYSTIWWMVTLMAIGGAHCLAAAFEWFNGRRWYLYQVLWSAKVRTAVSFLSILAWLWIVKMTLETGVGGQVVVLIMIAPTTVAMEMWICWENFRVRLAVDHRVNTSTMQFRR